MDKTIEELTLILAYLTQLTTYDRMTKSNDTFSFKSYDYNVLTELSKKGLIDIGDKPYKTNKLYFTDEGKKYVKSLLEKWEIDDNNKEN